MVSGIGLWRQGAFDLLSTPRTWQAIELTSGLVMLVLAIKLMLS